MAQTPRSPPKFGKCVPDPLSGGASVGPVDFLDQECEMPCLEGGHCSTLRANPQVKGGGFARSVELSGR